MAYTLSGNATSGSRFLYNSGLALNTTFSGSPGIQWARTFSTSDVTKIYFATLSVTSTPTSIDVTSLTDAYNNSISFTTVKHLQIVNKATTAGILTVGGGTNGLFAVLPDLVPQNPSSGSVGSCINLTTNIATSGSLKLIKLQASTGTISVDVLIVGA